MLPPTRPVLWIVMFVREFSDSLTDPSGRLYVVRLRVRSIGLVGSPTPS